MDPSRDDRSDAEDLRTRPLVPREGPGPGRGPELTEPLPTEPDAEGFGDKTAMAWGDPSRAAGPPEPPPAADRSTPDSGSGSNHDVVEEGAVTLEGEPQPGQVLFGEYRIERRLGQGGMGSVWLVRHLELDALRALKLIIAVIATNPQARARFRREARVMAKLAHPHAVTVHHAKLGRGVAFIEMEYVPGQGLDRILTPGRPAPADFTVRILRQLCDVLQAAHELGIVHRDLKPTNLMLLDGRAPGDEFLKVLDFGIAKILGQEEAGPEDFQTRPGDALFTPAYASPEQMAGGAVDARTDIYSVGVIAYELLTGFRPFSGPHAAYQQLYIGPPRFHERNPEASAPPAVEALVLRCLSRNPADRPASAREFFEAFRSAMGIAAPTEAGTAPGAVAAAFPTPTAGMPPTERGVADPRSVVAPQPPTWIPAEKAPARPRRRLVAIAVVAVLAVVAAVALVIALRPHPSPVPPGPVLPKGFAVAVPAEKGEEAPRVLVHEPSGARFVWIQGGQFTMGDDFDDDDLGPKDDQPAHPVELSDYYLQETEVTNGMMEAYFRAEQIPEDRQPERWRKAREQLAKLGYDAGKFPAVGISYELASKFASWVGGRLPTEAEWEFAARSRGEPNLYVWGRQPRPGVSMANINSVGEHRTNVVEPKTYPKDMTKQGIYDLTGNVREWCQDLWAPYVGSSEAVRDPKGPDSPPDGKPKRHVIRGGSFLSWGDAFATTGPRQPGEEEPTTAELAEDGSAGDVGFRVAIPWPPAATR